MSGRNKHIWTPELTMQTSKLAEQIHIGVFIIFGYLVYAQKTHRSCNNVIPNIDVFGKIPNFAAS